MEIYDIYREQYEHHLHHGSLSHRLQQQRSSSSPPTTNDCDEVLDLSRRCDSVETRKTPSPYATGSSLGTDSPSTHCGSPANSTTSTMTPNSILSTHERHQKKSITMPTLQQYPIYYPAVKRENSSPPSSTVQTATSDFSDTSPAHLLNPISLMSEHIQKTFSEKNYDRSTEVKSPITERLVDSLPLSTNGNVPLIYPKILMNDGKPTRPFKAFPRDPLVIAANFAATDVLYDSPRVERYTEYRKRVLEQIRSANGGQRTVTNPKMRRTSSRNSISTASSDAANAEHQANSSESDDRCTESSDNDASSSTPTTTNNSNNNNNNNPTVIDQNKNGVIKDAAYYERRRKNNAAAKKSRDRRRIKEDEIAIRAAYLERQNIELLCQLDALKAQLAQLTKQQC